MTKKIPWEKIKKRYLTGEKPATIAADYGLTSKQVRDKAHRGGWGDIKSTIVDEIATEIVAQVKTEIADTATLTGQIFGHLLQDIANAIPEMNAKPSIIAKHVNPYHKMALGTGFEILKEIEIEKAKNNQPTEKPGFNIIMPEMPDDV